MAKILVVEDTKDIRDLVQTLLEMQNYQVIVADNGAMALGMLAKESVDLIITDMNMPVMDGLELVRTLRANRYVVPIILMTANIGISEANGLAIGANAVIYKPFMGMSVLLNPVKALLP